MQIDGAEKLVLYDPGIGYIRDVATAHGAASFIRSLLACLHVPISNLCSTSFTSSGCQFSVLNQKLISPISYSNLISIEDVHLL